MLNNFHFKIQFNINIGTIELREETVETLLATACLLQLTSVIIACCNFLAKQLHPSNCLGFALFAEQQSCNTLLKLASAYTYHHFMQVIFVLFFMQLTFVFSPELTQNYVISCCYVMPSYTMHHSL